MGQTLTQYLQSYYNISNSRYTDNHLKILNKTKTLSQIKIWSDPKPANNRQTPTPNRWSV